MDNIIVEGVDSSYIYQIKTIVSGYDQAVINGVTALKPMDENIRAIRLKLVKEDYIRKKGYEPTQDELDKIVGFYSIANRADLEFIEMKLMLVNWQQIIEDNKGNKKNANIPITDENIKEKIPQADWKLLIKAIDEVAKQSRPFRENDDGDNSW